VTPYWMYVMGVAGQGPVPNNWMLDPRFSDHLDRHYFSVPSGQPTVALGDKALLYLVHHGLVAVVENTSQSPQPLPVGSLPGLQTHNWIMSHKVIVAIHTDMAVPVNSIGKDPGTRHSHLDLTQAEFTQGATAIITAAQQRF
jgi:hypothetical protein